MANDYESQRVKQTSVAYILNLLNSFQQRQNTVTKSHNNMYKELGTGLTSTYSNTQLAMKKQQFDRYYQDNKSNMSEETLSQYELLNSQYKMQEDLNINYKQGRERIQSIGEEVQNALVSYSDVNNMMDLNEEQKTAERAKMMAKVQEQIDLYTNFSGEFKATHNNRLNTAGFRADASYIDNLNEMFTFGIVQAEDDYLLDSHESQALQMGIMTGSYEPIKDYRSKEANRNNQLDRDQGKMMQDLYNEVETHGGYADKASAFRELVATDPDAAAIKAKETWLIDDDDEEYTYEDLLDNESKASGWEATFNETKEEGYTKLANLESIYTKRNGEGRLHAINISADEVFKSNIAAIYTPQKPTEIEYEDKTRTETKIDDVPEEKRIPFHEQMPKKDQEMFSKYFDESNFQDGKVNEETITNINKEMKHLGRLQTTGARSESNKNRIKALRQLKLSLAQYAGYLKKIKQLTNAGKSIPKNLANDVNYSITRASRLFSNIDSK